MGNKEAALADIDAVLAARATGEGGGTGAVAEIAARTYSCICRWAPKGSPLRTHAEKWEVQSTLEVAIRSKAAAGLAGVLRALRADIDADQLRTFEELVHANVFDDLLEQAEFLNASSYSRAASVMAGGTLEEHLRQLCAKHNVATVSQEGTPRKAASLNQDLYTPAGAYDKVRQSEVGTWLKLRNAAAHGEPDFETRYTVDDVRRMIDGIRSFIGAHPA